MVFLLSSCRGICEASGTQFALKQERPTKLWEYYITVLIREKMLNVHILPSFMSIEFGLLGNNASILTSDYVEQGSLIDVSNKVKSVTGRNIDEYIVMIFASELLSIIDHLHSCNIIHADIKPDNILLMSKISFECETPTLKLIDFGQAIDMTFFKSGTSFKTVSVCRVRYSNCQTV